MKTCPKCQMQYEEEIIKFCTKDGTPLVSTDKPEFTTMPSESIEAEDFGEETVIRRNPPPMADIPPAPAENEPGRSERVTIPVGEEPKPQVRPATAPAQYPGTPRKSNTGIIVALTMLGTLLVLGGGFLGYWFLSGGSAANSNVNTNSNIFVSNNMNSNGNLFDPNYNLNLNTNTNVNANTNVNTNANLKTPTPKPTPTPKANTNMNVNVNAMSNGSPGNTNTNTGPGPTPTPTLKPSPTASKPANINAGVLNSRATSLPKPAYPAAAKSMGASGIVQVAVTVDESGNVTSARAISGHPLLRQAAEGAARQTRFNPFRVGDKVVIANGVLVYNFIK